MKRKTEIQCLLAACAAAALLTGHAQDMREISFFTAMPAETAPKIDGVLDDACWKDAVPNTHYYEYVHINPNNPRRVDCPTECRIVYDANGVYAGVLNWEDRPEKMWRSATKSHQGGCCWNDCGEIYFDPAANGVGYYKFTVNANGCHDIKWRMDAANAQEPYRIPGVVTAAKVFNDRWEFELFVPWSAFHGRPAAAAGDVWTFNHCRFRFTHTQFFCTASPGGSNYTPEKFGYLYFSDGSKPEPAKICDLIARRLSSIWGIKIGDDVFVHDVKGTRKTDVDSMKKTSEETYRKLARELEPRLQEKANAGLRGEFDKLQASFTNEIARYDGSFAAVQAFDDLCIKMKNVGYLIAVNDLGTPGYIGAKLDLPYAGTYDFSEPAEYNGHNGWYRHNRPKDGYRTTHLDWIARVSKRPRVCFITGSGGGFRDVCEIADRFDIEAWYMPCGFGSSGVYEDPISHGRPLDKARQFESILAKNPDVFYVAVDGENWAPARYRYEILRRVADEGKGLVFSDRAPGSILAAAEKFGAGPRQGGANEIKFGKNVIAWLRDAMPPKWSLAWKSEYETRMARHWNAIRAAQGVKSAAVVKFPSGQGRDDCPATSEFLPFRIVADGAEEAFLRVRDDANRIVSTRTVKLAKGVNDLSIDTAGLVNGDFVLDVIPRKSGRGDFVCAHPFSKAGVLGSIVIDGTNISFVAEGKGRMLAVEWEKPSPEPVKVEWELRYLPYRQVRARGVTGLTGRNARGQKIARFGDEPFPTLAGELSVRIAGADGRVLGTARKAVSFPNHRYPDYTLISWNGPAHNNMDDLWAPVIVEELGYRSGLSDGGMRGAAQNFAPVGARAHVRIQQRGTNTYWTTLMGFCTPWGCKEVRDLGDEITPYDPKVQELVERYYSEYVKDQMRFGTYCWNLGDECSFSTGGGYGPKDRPAYCNFIAKRYGTVENYNRIHGTGITDFKDTPHPLQQEALARHDWASWLDHQQFMEQMYADAFQLFHTIAKRHDPKARVGAEGSSAGDIEMTINNLEFWGPYRSLVTDELIREVAPDTLRGIWWGGYVSSARNGYPLQQWEYVLTGTLNADLWFTVWPGSTEGMAGGDMTVAPYMKKMQPHLKALRRGIAQQLVRTPFRSEGAGLWVSHSSGTIAATGDRFSSPGDSQGPYVSFCHRYGYDVSFVTSRRLEWLGSKKIVFLCGAIVMSDDECAALLKWVKEGGIVVADFTPAVFDAFGAKRAKNPLAELFGDVSLDDLKPFDDATPLDVKQTIAYDGKTFDFAVKGGQFMCRTGNEPFQWKAVEKGGALLLNFTLGSARVAAGTESFDRLMQTIFGMKGIAIAESVSGCQPIFRVRQVRDMRIAGFKTTTKDLGKHVALDFGSEGWVYEVDKGFVGKTAKVDIAQLDSPFKVFASFAAEQQAPEVVVSNAAVAAGAFVTVPTDKLRKDSVYRLMVLDPQGDEIPNRELVFACDLKPIRLQFPYSDKPGRYALVLRDIATGLETRQPITLAAAE